jgi:choline dehydrogenase-like flavoprotein
MDAEEIHTDVCVVGAGPAGITIARELAAAGVRTCLLESGDREPSPDAQRQSRGESDGYPIHLLDQSRVRAFGGTLRHSRIGAEGWASRPLDGIDFEARTGVPGTGWPMTRRDLDPYYLRSVRTFPMRTAEDAETWWREQASPAALDLAHGSLEPTVFQFPVPSFTESWDVLAAAHGVQVLLRTRVVDLVVDATGRRVDRVVAVRGERERVVLRPRFVVVATGGIENARILLTADDRRGLGNEHDLVGRYFSERLSFHGGHIVLDGEVSNADLAMLHRPPGVEAGGGLRVNDDLQREHGLLNCAFFLMPRPRAVTRESLRSLSTLRKARSRRPIVPGVLRHSRNLLGVPLSLSDIALGRVVPRPQTLVLRTQGEQAPRPDSRVTLGSGRDDLGIPVARVTWRIAEEDFESIRRSASIVDEALRRRRIGRVQWTAGTGAGTLVEGNHHHLGTTRMHQDRRHGVVDPDCRVHGVANLYIGGCSVFPSYGASNPTLTIIALAHRLADHLRKRLETG